MCCLLRALAALLSGTIAQVIRAVNPPIDEMHRIGRLKRGQSARYGGRVDTIDGFSDHTIESIVALLRR